MKFDETELRQAVNILKPDSQLFEVRFIGNSGKLNFSGYFTSADTLVRELFKLNPSESGKEMRDFARLCGLSIDSRLKFAAVKLDDISENIDSEFGNI